jgi:ABC-type transport system involved in multi-copper enzyme maturation permease subunit
MLGSVFLLEWKNASRRSRHRRFRALYTGLVVAELLVFLFGWFWRTAWWSWFRGLSLHESLAELCDEYLWLLMFQHLLLLVLVTPAFAAGSVSDEKARGTFTLLLTTELTAPEIVLGKWLGQAVQVLVLALPALPLLALLQGVSGLSPAVVVAWAAESVLAALLLSAIGLVASVAAQRTTTAVVAVYLLLAGALGGAWMAGYGFVLDPLLLIPPAQGSVGEGWARLMFVAAGLTAACLALAAWRLRPACAAEGAPRRQPRWWAWLARPAVSDAPVRWKERYVGELGLFAFARKLPRPAWVGLALALGLLAAAYLPASNQDFALHGVGMVLVVSLLVAVRSSAAICRERERQTWDGLLMTPLEPYHLVRGKLWGIIDSVKPYLLAYLVGALVWAISNGPMAVLITAVSWLVSWPFLYFHAAGGLYQSARGNSSWQALVYTLADGVWTLIYYGCLAVFVTGVFTVGFLILWSLSLPTPPGPLAATVMVTVAFAVFLIPVCVQQFAGAESFLQRAEAHVAGQDRIVQGAGTRRKEFDAPVRPAHLTRS